MSICSVPSQGEQNKQTQKYLFTALICIYVHFFLRFDRNKPPIDPYKKNRANEREKKNE